MTQFREAVFSALIMVLLVVAGARLFGLNADEFRLLRAARHQAALIPSFGSLHGVGSAGSMLKRDPDQPGYLLLFVIRSAYLDADVNYWNQVIRSAPASRMIRYWGVCDSGLACGGSRDGSTFEILGFLDPYQMRIAAGAHAAGDALLYDARQTIHARVKREADPRATATAIIGRLQ